MIDWKEREEYYRQCKNDLKLGAIILIFPLIGAYLFQAWMALGLGIVGLMVCLYGWANYYEWEKDATYFIELQSGKVGDKGNG